MTAFVKKNVRGLVYLLIALIPAAVYIAPSLAEDFSLNETFSSILTALPLLSFLALGFLGWKLNQTRIFVSALLFLILAYLLRHPDALKGAGVGSVRLPQILAVSLPLSFALVFLVKDGRLMSWQTLAQIAVALAPPLFFITLLATVPLSFHNLFSATLVELPVQTRLPQITIATMASLAFVTWLTPDLKVRPFLYSLLWCLLPLIFVFHISLKPNVDANEASLYQDMSLLSVSAILLHTIFSMYWQRVYIDELTAIPNRRALDERMAHLVGQYALAMIDIDHFKNFNDTYGHDEGDNVLRLVARHMKEETRGRVYRYGGEEFCAVFENESLDAAEQVMDRCRSLLHKRKFHVRKAPAKRKSNNKSGVKKRGSRGGKVLHITVSVGIAEPGGSVLTPEQVIQEADKALYKAKKAGRNRVEVA